MFHGQVPTQTAGLAADRFACDPHLFSAHALCCQASAYTHCRLTHLGLTVLSRLSYV
jgi:hypothetical protein